MSVFNKVVAGALAASVMLPSLAFADTSSISSIIQKLQQQIAALNAQIAAMQTAQVQVKTSKEDVHATVKELKAQLELGASGDDVALLQTILASDPSIFPEGVINGVFGKKTSEAVKRFQKLTGLTPTGFVGPQTLNALNRFLKQHPIIVQTDASGNQTICALVLNGQKPKGWERELKRGREDGEGRHGNNGNKGTSAVGQIPVCAGGIPTSILNLFGVTVSSTTPTTTDVTAPVLSNISASGIAANGATIVWTTNESATSQVEYGTTSSYGSTTTLNASLVTGHSVALTGLASSTTYHFRVWSKDAANNVVMSSDMTFITSAPSDATAPTLSSIVAGNLTTTGATITWTTNEGATSQVDYGTTTSYGNSTSLDASPVTGHTVTLNALAASTLYHFRVNSKDASNNLATSGDMTFTTPAPVDATAPAISGISVSSIGSTTATISWNTDEAATGKVYYNLGNSFNLASASGSANSSLVTGHSFGLTGLTASSTYSYVLVSADTLGNTATTSAATFATTN